MQKNSLKALVVSCAIAATSSFATQAEAAWIHWYRRSALDCWVDTDFSGDYHGGTDYMVGGLGMGVAVYNDSNGTGARARALRCAAPDSEVLAHHDVTNIFIDGQDVSTTDAVMVMPCVVAVDGTGQSCGTAVYSSNATGGSTTYSNWSGGVFYLTPDVGNSGHGWQLTGGESWYAVLTIYIPKQDSGHDSMVRGYFEGLWQ